MRWRTVVASLFLVACHSSAASSAVDAGACDFDGGACEADNDQLAACVALTTGIYGGATVTCVGGDAPPGCSGCTTASLSVTTDAGVTAKPIFADGYYSVALDPGTYSVCCTDINVSAPGCASVTLAAGDVVRLDYSEQRSVGGIYCNVKAP